MGDWSFGRHYAPDLPLSTAVAASAAVPYAIGALTLPLPADGWWETDPATDLVETIAHAKTEQLSSEA